MSQQGEVRDHIEHLVVMTVVTHRNADVRRSGIAIIFHAIHAVQDARMREQMAREFIHFGMSLDSEERVREFFDVLGYTIAQSASDDEVFPALAFVAESIALYPDVDVRRAVLTEMLAGLYIDGRNDGPVDNDVIRRLTDIIEGRDGTRSDIMDIIMGRH